MEPDLEKNDSVTAREVSTTGCAGSSGRAVARFSSNREIAVVQADYLALANDLEQAQAISASLEIELSGKTNELARFKLIWERTQSDLGKLEHDLEALRRERHTLANEVQRAQAFELKFARLRKEHEDLAARADRLESELSRERTAHLQTRAELDAMQTGAPSPTDHSRERELRQTLEALRTRIDRALGSPAASQPAADNGCGSSGHIDIQFGA